MSSIIEGHQVGGVTIDLIGNIYVADFADDVWKITPKGDRQLFATGFYGSSGNVIDHEGNLLQSSYYGDTITRVDRGVRSSGRSSKLRGRRRSGRSERCSTL